MTGMEPRKLARCSTDPACPRRWADGGPDRPCGQHHGDSSAYLTARSVVPATTSDDDHDLGLGPGRAGHEPSEASRT